MLAPVARGQRVLLFDRELLPAPVFHAVPGLVDLYWAAWEQAWTRVVVLPGDAGGRYLRAGTGVALNVHDAAFMALFCKYSPRLFPVRETLDYIYRALLDDEPSPVAIEFVDSPPLLAWAESEYYRVTGDEERLRALLREKKFLQRYFYLFDSLAPGTRLSTAHRPVTLEKRENGYRWSAAASATGDVAREREEILWVDAISQQALAASCIARLADEINYKEAEKEFRERYKGLKALLNKLYWDEGTGFYHDLRASDLSRSRAKTPGGYWAMLAGAPSPVQARRAATLAVDSSAFGGNVPRPSVSRDDPSFDDETGARATVAYAGVKALEQHGFLEEADAAAYRLLLHQYETFLERDPGAPWEEYHLSRAEPSRDTISRGWAALVPVALFIENVLGFRVDAPRRVVEWRKHHRGLHGIKNLSFGKVIADIVGDEHAIQVHTNEPFTLVVNGRSYHVRKGSNTFK
jgi:glycogen debranching enzyme